MSEGGGFAAAYRHFEAGRLQDAHRICHQVLAADPNHIDALHLIGFIALQSGQPQDAVQAVSRAIAIDGRLPDLHNTLGEALRGLGRVNEAIACYRRALALAPNNAAAHGCLGNALLQQGKAEEAAASYARAVALQPGDAALHYNLGNALHELRRLDEADTAYRRAIALRPRYAEAHNNLGNALRARHELEAAITSYRQALAVRPDFVLARRNLAVTLLEQGKPGDAIVLLRQAVTLAPDCAETYNSLGNALRAAHEPGFGEAALAAYDRALSLTPHSTHTQANRAKLLRELGRYEEATSEFERLVALDPDRDYVSGELLNLKALCCDWQGFDAALTRTERAVDDGKRAIVPFSFLCLSPSASGQLHCARIFASDDRATPPGRLYRGERYAHDRIRVAYLSSDFYNHATAYLMAGLFEAHDRSRFETVACSYGTLKDNMTTRLARAFDRFVDVAGEGEHDIARRLKELEIDIAIDLKGYTQGMRPGILAQRPAPIQVSYLGYPGTMGVDHIDYILADRIVIPEDQQSCYSERVVYLPESYQPNDQRREIADRTPTRAEAGLPATGFVFCSFNSSYKITPAIFGVWMRLLREVEGSVLWLLDDNALAICNLRREAEQRGVAGDRLVFAARAPLADHLARHRRADLMLDTFPCNAHTTASDALWAGLPLVTLHGGGFAGRVAGSLLHAVGLPELITETLAHYESTALALAQDRERLGAIKAKLAGNRAIVPLFDTNRTCRHIESAYETMWSRHQRGEPPASFAVTRQETV